MISLQTLINTLFAKFPGIKEIRWLQAGAQFEILFSPSSTDTVRTDESSLWTIMGEVTELCSYHKLGPFRATREGIVFIRATEMEKLVARELNN